MYIIPTLLHDFPRRNNEDLGMPGGARGLGTASAQAEAAAAGEQGPGGAGPWGDVSAPFPTYQGPYRTPRLPSLGDPGVASTFRAGPVEDPWNGPTFLHFLTRSGPPQMSYPPSIPGRMAE